MENLKVTFLDEWTLRRFLKSRIDEVLTSDMIEEIVSEVYGSSCVAFVYDLLVGDFKQHDEFDDPYEIMRKFVIANDIADRFKRLGDGVQSIGVINLDPIAYMTEPSHNKELQKLISYVMGKLNQLPHNESLDEVEIYHESVNLLRRITGFFLSDMTGENSRDVIICLQNRGTELDIAIS